MDLFFAGAEQGMWRDLLYDNGVRHMSLSFMGLRRRVKHLSRWRLADKFPSDVRIYLDSGAFTLNKADSTVSVAEASDLREEYFQFVSDNIYDIEFASEFDANVLGHEGVFSSRESFWATLPARKWMPVWHGDYGTNNLVALADEFEQIGVLQDDAGGDLTPILNRIADQTRLHGVAMTRMEALNAVRWDSAGSTSWLSPSQYGDTIIWTGREMKRYPKDMKETGRKRHRTWLDSQGFDTALIESDDRTELLRVSIWSWQKYIQHISGVTPMPETPPGDNAESLPPVVDTPATTTWNETPPGEVSVPPERQLLPVVGFTYEKTKGDDGEDVDEARMTTPSSTLLQCSTCFMKDKCPAAEPGSACKYEIPVQIRTASQIQALSDALIEMQTQRVLLMRMIEQTEGGYADPNLTTELARLWKMIQDRQTGRDTVKLTLEATGQAASAGRISRLFGADAGERLAELDQPRDTQTVMSEIVDAEVVDP